MYHRIDLIGSQSLVYKKGKAIDPALQPVGQTLTNNIEGEIEISSMTSRNVGMAV